MAVGLRRLNPFSKNDGRLAILKPIDSELKKGRRFCRARFMTVDWMQNLQWPAMVATLLSAWLVAGQSKWQRQWGFWIFLLSNVLWIGWGWHDHAYALIVLQIGLVILNIR